MTENIPYADFGGSGASLHFLHANGYPPACYAPLIERLKPRLRVSAMRLRPLWPNSNPAELRDWHPLSDDFLRFVSGVSAAGPVFAVGHSVGGIVALRAALREPGRFRALVLMEPVLFPPEFILFWNLVRAIGMGHRWHPKIPAALSRRRRFDDLERAFRGYRRREVFRYFSDESLRAYIAGITRPCADGGYELAYSPEWEARIYYTGAWRDLDLWRGWKRLQTPTLILRGARSDTLWAGTADRVRRANPNVRVETLEDTTHLLPMEKPEEVSRLIIEFFDHVYA